MNLLSYMLALLLLVVSSPIYGDDMRRGVAFICDTEMLSCQVADPDLAIGDSVGFFDREGKLYAIGEVMSLEVGFREVEITQLFSKIAADAVVRVITDRERKNQRLDKHTYRPKHRVGASFAYKRLALVDSLAGFDYGVYFARSLHANLSVHVRSSYSYVAGVVEREEIDYRHTFDVQAVIMSFYPGLTYETFPRQPFSLLLELGAGVAAVNTSRPDGVKLDEEIAEIAGTHLLLRAMLGLQLSVRDWRLQAGIAQQFIGSIGAHEFNATLVRGI